MAPFLHGRKALEEIRTTIRSLLLSRKKTADTTDNAGSFEKIDDHHKMFDVERNGTSAFATADRLTKVSGDPIPLHSIRVTDQVDVYLGQGRDRQDNPS
ncbi:MAG: hypothetical protein LQ348_005678 [Seirophora lacunosa]|nr:MAG: hypothetical protein LQ348_005678 [Seirophora lacunosa]